MDRHLKHAPALLPILLAGVLAWTWTGQGAAWKHLSSKTADLLAPNPGTQQTSSVVFDIDQDGVNDFVITERTAAPSVVWYRRGPAGWSRHVLDESPLRIEAGSWAYHILAGRSNNLRRAPRQQTPCLATGARTAPESMLRPKSQRARLAPRSSTPGGRPQHPRLRSAFLAAA